MIDRIIPHQSMFGSPYCSSVDLWLKSSKVEHITIAGRNDGVECLGVIAKFDKPHLWIPYISDVKTDASKYLEVIDWMRNQVKGQYVRNEELLVFVDTNSDTYDILLGSKWNHIRNFPVELQWQLSSSDKEVPPSNFTLAESFCRLSAAQVFIDTFSDKWKWYFREMGCSHDLNRSSDIEIVARYMDSATYILLASDHEGYVGISSVRKLTNCLAEFHTGVGISPRLRGRGLGKFLVKETLNRVISDGINVMQVHTQECLNDRNDNLRMYIQSGAERKRSFAILQPGD